MANTTVSVRIGKDEYTAMRRVAELEGRKLTWLLNRAIYKYLEKPTAAARRTEKGGAKQ